MTSEAAENLEDFFRGFGGAKPLLLLDYDGTLAPFRVDRFQARPWAGVRELLSRIQRQGRTRMAIVTGRPAVEIAPLLGLDPPLEVWGLHGVERLFPDGKREMEIVPEAELRKLEELRRQFRADSFGGNFEDKANGVVMHWRGASRAKARRIERKTSELLEPLAQMDGLSLIKFEFGMELRTGRDKGGAIEAILQEVHAYAPVAFLGDDLSDEAAFRALEGRGLSVLVRRAWRETAANVWLRPPVELREFLRQWLRAVEGHGTGNREQGTLRPRARDRAE